MTDVEQIKQKIDIVTLVSEYVLLKKTGVNFKGLCPFHNEKTPSFIVSAERQIWHCFGACQDGGDIFKFFMKAENVEFSEALKILAKRAGVKLSTSYETSRTAAIRERIFEINHLASEFYNYILTSHPLGKNAREYLAGRKISDSSIKLFSLGYAPNSWDSLASFLSKKGYSPEELSTAGLVSKSAIGNYFDRFRGRIIFTLRDQRGNVAGFAGRLLSPDAKEAKYINTSETPVYTKGEILYGLDVTREEIKKEGFAVVVEGEIDAISSYQAGVRNVVAIKGSALTSGHVSLLKRYTEDVYLSLDSDFAGDAAAHRGIEIADSAGLNIKVVAFSGGKDPDELIKKDPKLWREAVTKAINFYDFVIDSATSRFDVNKPEEAKKVVSEVAKFIAPIDNLVVKSHYLRKLAEALKVPQESLEEQLGREFRKSQIGSASGLKTEAKQEGKPPRLRQEILEDYLLSLILQSTKPSDYLLLIAPRLQASDFSSQSLGQIYNLLWSWASNPKSDVALPEQKFSIAAFAKLVPAELLPTLDRLYLAENPIDQELETEVLSEIQRAAWKIRELTLREKLRKISTKIKENPDNAELENDFAKTAADLSKLIEEKTLVFPNNSLV